MEASITLKNVGKRFKENHVISDLSFGIEKGSTFTIVGRDGAGKSTLLKILSGLTGIDSGQVYIQGQEINKSSQEFRHNLAFLPPHNIHNPWITGRQNIEKYLDYSSTTERKFRKKMKQFSSLLEFDQYLDSIPEHYPKGIKRRLDLILVLIQDAPILLLDEPLKDLDYHTRGKLLNYLKEIKGEKTTVIATDEFTEIETVTDRWIVLHKGMVRYDGDLETMVEHVDLDFTGYLEIKADQRSEILQELEASSLVNNIQDLGNTIQIATDSATNFLQLIQELGEENFCRIAGNSVNMNYLLDQLTSDEGLQ
ncbi:MAG TPA: ABC transporter ATP-binding protein [bacterium]|nr:ABC transporter ATP-binding protein [bacterium]